MESIVSKATDVVRRFYDAYLRKRDLYAVTRCVTDDVRWIGTGAFERAGEGFRHYLDILREELENDPEGYGLTLRNLRAVPLGKSACYVEGDFWIDRCLPDGGTHRLDVRFTAVCVVQADGECRIRAVHASLPCGAQGEGEYFPAMLLGEGGQSASSGAWRSAFELLQASLPGGLVGGYIEDGFPLYFINDQLLEHLGYTYDEFVKETRGMVDNAIHPDDRAGVAEIVTEAFRHTDRYEVTYRMRKKDGSYTWVLDRGRRTVTDEGRDAIVCIIIDVTESRELHERLRQGVETLKAKNTELETFYQIVFSGFAKLADDPGYSLLYANDQFFQIFGYSREEVRELLGNQAMLLFHPDSVRATDAAIRSRGGRFSVKFRCATKGGGSVWLRMDACRSGESYKGHNVLYCFFTDIDEEERRNAAYLRQQYFMSLISTSIAGGTFVTRADDERRPVYVSDSLLSFLGYSREAFEAEAVDGLISLVPPEDRDILQAAGRGKDYYEVEYRLRKADGTLIWALEKGRLIRGEDGGPVYICILLDITERKLRQDELIRQTRLDPLTGLYNREYAQRYIGTYLDIHRDVHSSALLVFDLDNFKQVNDRRGHLVGDAVLMAFADLLRSCSRARDFAARVGGDEFLLFMQDVPSHEDAAGMAERVRAAMREGLGAEYADCGLSVSIGVAFSQEKGLAYDAFFQAADDDMYRMKFRGRGGREGVPIVPDAEDERRFLFRNTFGLVMRIDLDTGHYTIPYGAYLAHANLPLRGDYDAMLRHCFSIYVSEDERDGLFDRVCLAALDAGWREGGERSCEYRVSDGKGSFVWVRSRFFFTRLGGKRLSYKTISDVTENRRDREGGRLAALYDFALRDEPGEIYEINLTRQSFRTLRRNPLFQPLPDQGSLDFLRAEAGAMMHPEDRARFAGFLTLADAARDGEPFCEKFRCRWRDGEYYWVAVNVLAVEEGEERVRLACVMAAEGRGGRNGLSCPNEGRPGVCADEERCRIIMEQTRCAVFDFDASKDEHYAPYLGTLFDCRTDMRRVPDMLRSLVVHSADRELLQAFHAALRTGEKAETTVRLKRRGGPFAWCRIRARVQRDDEGQLLRLGGTIVDVDENVHALQSLRYQAEHDPLTGYSNFVKFKADAVRMLAERGGRACSLWYCDIRNFKFINDIYGYDTGDALLNYWARVIADGARPGETFARISGDNFVMLRWYEGPDDVAARFQRGAELLSRFEGLANRRFRVEMIAGVYLVEKPEDLLGIDDMLDRANIAQKSVKRLSGSKFAIYSDEMRRRVLYEKAIEGCMEEALRAREFIIYLQPQIDIQHGDTLFGAEVLVRWERPGHGMVPPGDFIPLFERNGFIVELDAFVFEEACAYLASRRERGLPLLRLSVNVSRITLAQGDFLDRYTVIRDRYDIPDGLLELECTETVVIRNYDLFREIMATLPARGFRSAMDDFGTGYSSLNMLKEIVLDVLKLDIGFFRQTEGTPRERAVVESIIKMARALGMATVAEGVERREQVDFLRSVGCDAVQGYVFSRPLSLPAFEETEKAFTAPA